MKQIMILLICTIWFNPIFGQLDYEFKFDDKGNIYFDEIIELDSIAKDILYKRGKEWVYDTFKSGDAVIEIEDKEAGKIVGKGMTHDLIYKNIGINNNGGNFRFKLTLMFKEGRTRILINNLYFVEGEMIGVNSGAYLDEDYPAVFGKFGKKQIKKKWLIMRQQAIEEFELIIANYKNSITTKEEDW